MRAGDRASVAGDPAAADTAYGRALERAPADWVRRPDVLVAQIAARREREDWAGCVQLAEAEMARCAQGHNASVADFAYYAHACAKALEDEASLAKIDGLIVEHVGNLLARSDAPLSADDRSEALRILRTVYDAQGQKPKARATAIQQRRVSDRAARSAPSPRFAMTFHWPRAEVYNYLGQPGDLVDDLTKSIEALPDQYDPPYRLAWIYQRMGRHDEALAMAQRALERVYGPRKGRVLSLIGDIYKAKNDPQAELATRIALVDLLTALPPGHTHPAAHPTRRGQDEKRPHVGCRLQRHVATHRIIHGRAQTMRASGNHEIRRHQDKSVDF